MAETRKPKLSSRKATGGVDPMARMSRMLMKQARTLDGMFTQLVSHAADNQDIWPMTADRYIRLAFRAQANCRSALIGVAKAERELQRAQDEASE